MKTIAQQLNVKEFPFYIKDSNGNQIYYENSNGYWSKREWDSNGKVIYYETSHGTIIDNRPKEVILSMDEIAQRLNIPVSQLKIKK